MKNKKLLFCIIVIALIAIVAVVIFNRKNPDDTSKVSKVGVILPLTGQMSAYGERLQAAIRLAESEQTEQGKGIKIKFLIEDGKFTAKDSITAFHKLQNSNVDTWLIFGDLPLLGMRELLADTKKPVLCLIGAPDLIKNYPNLIHFSGSSVAPARELGNYAGEAGIKTSVVIFEEDEASQSYASGFENALKRGGGRVLEKIPFIQGSQNIRAVVLKAMEHKSDAIYVYAYGLDYVAVMNEIVQQKYSGIILSDSNINVERKNLIDGGEGFWYADFDFGSNSDNPKTRHFIQAMEETYKITPCVFSAFIYEAAKNIIEAVQTNGPKSEEIQSYLFSKGEYQSVIGKIQCLKNEELKVYLDIKKAQKSGDIMLKKN